MQSVLENSILKKFRLFFFPLVYSYSLAHGQIWHISLANQVKKIARKYRTQTEEQQKSQEEVQAELEGVKAQLREKEAQLSNQAQSAPDQSLLDQAKEAGRQETNREFETKVQELSQQVIFHDSLWVKCHIPRDSFKGLFQNLFNVNC